VTSSTSSSDDAAYLLLAALIGAVVAICVGLILWFVFLRKRERDRENARPVEHHTSDLNHPDDIELKERDRDEEAPDEPANRG